MLPVSFQPLRSINISLVAYSPYSPERVVLFYIVTATQCLFRNILNEPLQFGSFQDVDMLHQVPALLEKIPIRHLTPAEIIHLKFLNRFTTELARLGRCAILKAQRESSGSRNPTSLN